MRKVNAVAIVLLILSLNFISCATMIKSGAGRVALHSNPSGAEVLVNRQALGKTPVTLELDNKSTHQVTLGKNEKERTCVLNKKAGPARIILKMLAKMFL